MNSFGVANLMISIHIPIIFPVKLSNKMGKNKKFPCFFFYFKEIPYLCSPKMNHYTLLLPKQAIITIKYILK